MKKLLTAGDDREINRLGWSVGAAVRGNVFSAEIIIPLP